MELIEPVDRVAWSCRPEDSPPRARSISPPTGPIDGTPTVRPSAVARAKLDRWNVVVFADDRDAVARSVGDPQLAGILMFDRS